MAINKVELCGVNTSRLPVLNAEEKETLLKKAREGDAAARERYIQGNLRLVLSVIKRFSNSSENADDLFQIGCIGLIKAIDNFDTTLNVRFSTYAVPMIIGEIRRYLRDNNAIRVSRSLRDTAYRAICARELYLKQNQKEPSIEEIAAEIGIGKEDIVYALDAIQSPMSLYEPVYTEGGDPLYIKDQLSDKKNKEENWCRTSPCRTRSPVSMSANARSSACGSMRGRPRWRLPGKSASRRRRSAGWKSPPCALCGIISPTSGNARRSLNFCKLQPVIRRRHSIVFPEHTGIVKGIFKSARQRRLFDRHPHLQQLF